MGGPLLSLQPIFRGFLWGGGFFLGFFSTALLAVAVNGTIKTWTSGEVLTASDLNTTISSLKTAIEGIPNWTKNGNNAYYTSGDIELVNDNPFINFNSTSTSGSTGFAFRRSSSTRWGIWTNSGAGTSNDDFSITRYASNGTFQGNAFVISNSNGFIGIGSNSPSVKLHVEGDACTTGTGMTTCASDRRLKKNIQPIKNALNTILKIKPVNFTWNEKAKENFGYENGQKDMGVIAQDIEKINPEWVENTNKGYKRVKDTFTKWYPINAIQELKILFDSKNVEFANNLSTLQSENEILKNELSQLKQQNQNIQVSLEKINKQLEGLNYAKR